MSRLIGLIDVLLIFHLFVLLYYKYPSFNFKCYKETERITQNFYSELNYGYEEN